jgi:hypothetical protein
MSPHRVRRDEGFLSLQGHFRREGRNLARSRLLPKFLTAANSPSVGSSPAVISRHRLGTGDVTVPEAAF